MNLDLVNKLTKPDGSLAAGGQSVSAGEFSGKTLIRAACPEGLPFKITKMELAAPGRGNGSREYPGNIQEIWTQYSRVSHSGM